MEAKKAYEDAKKAAIDAQDKADKLSTEYDIINGRLETVNPAPYLNQFGPKRYEEIFIDA